MPKLFDKIIREINPKQKYHIDQDTEKLIIYNPKTGEYSYERGFFSRLFNPEEKHYIVNFDQFERIDKLDCIIYDPNENQEIKLRVTCLIGCHKSKAHKLVRLANKEQDLESAVRKLFVNWTNAFIDTRNINIKRELTEVDGKLRSHYENYAKARGLHLQIVRIELDDELGRFLDGFSISTDDPDSSTSEVEYHTSVDNVNVRLRIHVQGKGNSTGGNLSKYDRSNVSLFEQIKFQTIEFTRQWFRKTSPEDIFLTDRDKHLDELKKGLTKFYQEEFNVMSPVFTITPLETDLQARLMDLMREQGRFHIQDKTKTIEYEFIYRVVGISDWNQFYLHQRKYANAPLQELGNISEILKNEVELGINRHEGVVEGIAKQIEFDDYILSHFNSAAKTKVHEQFGVLLGQTPSLKRIATKEVGSGKISSPLELLLTIKERNINLVNDHKQLTLSGEDNEEKLKIEKEIKENEDEITRLTTQLGAENNTAKIESSNSKSDQIEQ